MRIDNAKKITAVAGAAVLSIGIAGPALAGTGAAQHRDQSPTAQPAMTKDAVHAALATAGIRGLFGADRDGRNHGRQVARTGDASSAAVRSDPAKVPATHRVGPGRSVHASAVCRHDAGRTVTFHQSGGQFASFGGHPPHAQHR